MKKPTTKQIIAKLKRKPGKTASELGTTAVRMRAMEKKGLVREIERRRTGRVGRPAVEWATA